MKVSFVSAEIEALCRLSKLVQRTHGALVAKKLRRRLSELFAASAVGELVSGRPHPLEYDRTGQFAVDLHGGKRLIFTPSNSSYSGRGGGSIDWSKISEITIVAIEDYHD